MGSRGESIQGTGDSVCKGPEVKEHEGKPVRGALVEVGRVTGF